MTGTNHGKVCLVMVGLPARGKSTIAARLKENLKQNRIATAVFNNGDLRRSMIPGNTSFAKFYDPTNEEGTALRERIARINITNAKEYLDDGGDVAILDATHVSGKRRELVREMFAGYPVLFIECISTDQEILEASIAKKATMPEFEHLDFEEAKSSFKERIDYYKHIYTPFSSEPNTIRFDSLNNRILASLITEAIPHYEQIRDLLVTDSVKNLFLVRHAESEDNVTNRIGGNAPLTERGRDQAERLGRHFRETSLPYIFCSGKLRTIQTSEPICREQSGDSMVISLPEFNEIHSGVCEGMSYQEIKETMPDVYKSRLRDKYNYIYPQGEGYVTMRPRIDRGIKKALFLSGNAENVMIIGHRAVNRMILSHFLYRRMEDVPYIYVPLERYYHIVSTQQKKLFELKWVTEPGEIGPEDL